MIIAIDATTLGSHSGGDETLMLSLLGGLGEAIGARDRVQVLAVPCAPLPARLSEDARFAVDRAKRRLGMLHFSRTLPSWLRGLLAQGTRPDVVVSVTHAPLNSPVPVALVVTDLSFRHVPDCYPLSTRLRLSVLVPRQARAAAGVITISDFCRRDLLDSYGLPPGRVHIVPPAIEPPQVPAESARAALATRGVRSPFLLYLGNLHPRKNVPLAVRAFLAARAAEPNLSGHQFVIAGRRWFGSRAEETEAANAPRDSVLLLDRVNTAEREVLLRDAEAVVYLSTFEGFGLPPLEAMARGTAVIASDRTAVQEVCEGAGVLVDPDRPEQVRTELRRILTDPELRSALVRRGYERAQRYSVAHTGQALMDALRAMVQQNVRPGVAVPARINSCDRDAD